MTSNTVKRGLPIDLVAIARWRNEGGAPGPLKRGANRLRLYDALIPMRGVDLNQYGAARVQKDTEFGSWLRPRLAKERATENINWETASPTRRRAPPKMTVRRSWLRGLRKTHDEGTWPQACPMTYGGFLAKYLTAPHLCNNLTPP
jgi:hypothetical protein